MDYKRKTLPEAKPTVQQNPTQPKRPQPTTPVYFWKPHEIPYGIFSQWYKKDFKVPNDNVLFTPWYEQGFKVPNGDGTESRFNCAEQYMMHRKALLFKDEKTAALILSTSDPWVQKKLGQAVEGFDEKIWKRERTRIVRWGSYWKFKEDPSALLNTGDRELVEASPYDRIWGIGFSPSEASEKNRKFWGMNLLGGALVAARKRFREEMENAKKREEMESAKKREEMESTKKREEMGSTKKREEMESVKKREGMESAKKREGMESVKKREERDRGCEGEGGEGKGGVKEKEKVMVEVRVKVEENVEEKDRECVKEVEKDKEKECVKGVEKDKEKECVKEGDVKK